MQKFNEEELKNEKYQDNYSDDSFWEKAKTTALKVGAKGMYYALNLYHVLQKDDVPLKEKSIIVASLGYFILPLDVIPDFMPVVGYTDDLAALAFSFAKVSYYIDEEVILHSKQKMREWFSLSESECEKLI